MDAFKIFQSSQLDGVGWRLGLAGFSELGLSTRLSYVDEQELSSARITRILDAIGFPAIVEIYLQEQSKLYLKQLLQMF